MGGEEIECIGHDAERSAECALPGGVFAYTVSFPRQAHPEVLLPIRRGAERSFGVKNFLVKRKRLRTKILFPGRDTPNRWHMLSAYGGIRTRALGRRLPHEKRISLFCPSQELLGIRDGRSLRTAVKKALAKGGLASIVYHEFPLFSRKKSCENVFLAAKGYFEF